MDTQTQQFVYRLAAVVLGLAVLGTLGFIIVVALSQGDGEAVRLADTLTPWLLGTLAAFVAVLFGHQAVAALLAKYAAAAATAGVASLPGVSAGSAAAASAAGSAVSAVIAASAPASAPHPAPLASVPVAPVVPAPAGLGSAS